MEMDFVPEIESSISEETFFAQNKNAITNVIVGVTALAAGLAAGYFYGKFAVTKELQKISEKLVELKGKDIKEMVELENQLDKIIKEAKLSETAVKHVRALACTIGDLIIAVHTKVV